MASPTSPVANRIAQFEIPASTDGKKNPQTSLTTKTSLVAVKSTSSEAIVPNPSKLKKFSSSLRTISSGSNGMSLDKSNNPESQSTNSLLETESSTSSERENSTSDIMPSPSNNEGSTKKRIQPPNKTQVIPVHQAAYKAQKQVLQKLIINMNEVSKKLDLYCGDNFSLNKEINPNTADGKEFIQLLNEHKLVSQDVIDVIQGKNQEVTLFASLSNKSSKTFRTKIEGLFKEEWHLTFKTGKGKGKVTRETRKILSKWVPEFKTIQKEFKDIDFIYKSELKSSELFEQYMHFLYEYREKLSKFTKILGKIATQSYSQQHVITSSSEKFFDFIAPQYSEDKSKLGYQCKEVSSNKTKISQILGDLLEVSLTQDNSQKELNSLIRFKHSTEKELLKSFFSIMNIEEELKNDIIELVKARSSFDSEYKKTQFQKNRDQLLGSLKIISDNLEKDRVQYREKLQRDMTKFFPIFKKINERITKEIELKKLDSESSPKKNEIAQQLYQGIADEISNVYIPYFDNELISQIKERFAYCEEVAQKNVKDQLAAEKREKEKGNIVISDPSKEYNIGQNATYLADTIKNRLIANIKSMTVNQDSQSDWERAIAGGTLVFLDKEGKPMVQFPVFSAEMSDEDKGMAMQKFISDCNQKFAEAIFEDDTLFNNFHKICKEIWFNETTPDNLQDHAKKSVLFFEMLKKDQTNSNEIKEIQLGNKFQLQAIVDKIKKDKQNAATIEKYAKIWNDENQLLDEKERSLLNPEVAVIYSLMYYNSLLYIAPSQSLGWGVVLGPVLDGYKKINGNFGDALFNFKEDLYSCEIRLVQIQVTDKRQLEFTILQAAKFGHVEDSKLLQNLKLNFPLVGGKSYVKPPVEIDLIHRVPSGFSEEDTEKLETTRVKFSHMLNAAEHSPLKEEIE